VQLNALPLTSNGKLDRSALPCPDQQALLHHQEQFVAPFTPIQQIIAQIWTELLHVSQIGTHDNFFALETTWISSKLYFSICYLADREVYEGQALT
jgi:hypothetical protein